MKNRSGRLPEDFAWAGMDYLNRPEGVWFWSINLKDTHPDDRLAVIGLLAKIVHQQDRRIDNAIREFKKLTERPETHTKTESQAPADPA